MARYVLHARMRRVGTAVVVLCALLAGGACTSGGDEKGDDKPARAERPPKLQEAWKTRSATPVSMPGTQRGLAWTGYENVLAVRESGGLRGYDTRTGKKLWKLDPPKDTSGICGMSDEVNDAGLGGLLFTSAKKEDQESDKDGEETDESTCTYAGAVDIKDGTVKWAEDLGELHGEVSIGDEALTVTTDCYGVKQFRPRDGKSLGTRLKADRACAHNVDHNGHHLAVREAPLGDAEEKVPGWIPAADGAPASFALYEGADTKPAWRTKAARVGDKLHGIVSDDPLVLDISREGHRLLQTYDGDGKPLRTIGKQLRGTADSDTAQQVGPLTTKDTLVTNYEHDPALYAYDLDSGKVRWKKQKLTDLILGVWKDKLLAVRKVQPSRTTAEQWLVTYGIKDGKERTVGRLGRRDDAPEQFAVWDDDRIYLRRSDSSGDSSSIVAYSLPRSGGDARTYRGKTMDRMPDATLVPRGWRKGDLKPDRVATACEAVSPTALKAMRVYRKDMPPPVDCTWEERYAPRHGDRTLKVKVVAHQPGEGVDSGAGSSTSRRPEPAVEVAKTVFKETGDGSDDDSEEQAFTDAHRVDGLGDEAKAAVYGSVSDHESTTYLLVRYRNVTVRIEAGTEAPVQDLRSAVPPQHRAEAAARLTAADVLAKLGADVPAAERRLAKTSGGSITKVKSVCSRLSSEAAGLTPGAGAVDTTPKGGSDGRVAGCYWYKDEDLSPSLEVRIAAIPDSPLTGEDAEKQAKAEITSAEGKELSGFGDEARIEPDHFEHKEELNRRHTLTARKGNLVLVVEYGRWHHPDAGQMDADVKRVAKRVLDAY